MEHVTKAVVVTAPLEIQDLPIPEPGPGEVLVRIEASGPCHTDIYAALGNWPVKPTLHSFPATKASANVGYAVFPCCQRPAPLTRSKPSWPSAVSMSLSHSPRRPHPFDQAFRSLRLGGRRVCVALPADNAALNPPIVDTVVTGKTVIGSIVGTRNESIEDVLSGRVPALSSSSSDPGYNRDQDHVDDHADRSAVRRESTVVSAVYHGEEVCFLARIELGLLPAEVALGLDDLHALTGPQQMSRDINRGVGGRPQLGSLPTTGRAEESRPGCFRVTAQGSLGGVSAIDDVLGPGNE